MRPFKASQFHTKILSRISSTTVDINIVCLAIDYDKKCLKMLAVTGRTRRETCRSICKALFQNMVKYRQGQTSVDGYVEGKTQEYSGSKRGSTIGEQYPTGQGRGIIQVY